MSIRPKSNKDHLKYQSKPLSAVLPTKCESDPLIFLTTARTFVDLHPFANGEGERDGPSGTWLGPFKGRPELIRQLAPALHDRLLPLAKKSVSGMLNSLRAWWRIFDAAEAVGEPPVTTVLDLSNVHRQLAYDAGMRRTAFTQFISIANVTRQILKARQLHWATPSDPEAIRNIPPTWQSDMLRHALKRAWYSIVDRWTLADRLLSKDDPVDDESERLRRNYRFYISQQSRHKTARPSYAAMRAGFSTNKAFYDSGLNLLDMLRGFYPDGDDIRTAFHLCLITTGWNPAVLLNIDIEGEYITAHPKNAGRYILRSTKDRAGGTEITTEGLFKTQFGAGFIIRVLIERSAPLRQTLRADLHAETSKLDVCTDARELLELQAKIKVMQDALRSPWLYAATNSVGIKWLHDDNYAQGGERQFLKRFIDSLNRKLQPGRRLAFVNPTDLRDIYAANIYRASGGSILAVMKALQHRSLRSTPAYITNLLIKLEHQNLIIALGNDLWKEIKIRGRIDPTILAKNARYGPMTAEEEERLIYYRSLPKTRMGTSCRSPNTPPAHIAPDFVQDGRKVCDVQRCLLCVEHAVILEESVDGIAKRCAELRQIRSKIGQAAWLASSFDEELGNVDAVLTLFDAEKVEQLIHKYTAELTIHGFA